jgi:hypothetical protein
LCYFSVSNTEAKRQRRRKLWKKKKKKDTLIREEGQSASWRYSDTNSSATALSLSVRAEDIGAPDTWLTRAERQKHKKMKKERDKMPHVGRQEEVSYILKLNLIIYCCCVGRAGYGSDGC